MTLKMNYQDIELHVMDREAFYKYSLKTRMLSATIHVCVSVWV